VLVYVQVMAVHVCASWQSFQVHVLACAWSGKVASRCVCMDMVLSAFGGMNTPAEMKAAQKVMKGAGGHPWEGEGWGVGGVGGVWEGGQKAVGRPQKDGACGGHGGQGELW